jgi:hypothetical protein
MKKLIGNNGILMFLAFIIAIGASCENDDHIEEVPDNTDSSQVQEDDPQDQEDNPQVQEDDPQLEFDPNQLMASLILDNMKVINGTPSTSKNNAKNNIDLKIDSDTIFWTPGIIKRIKIQKPLGVSLKNGAWVYVPGADSYIEATLREDEESDEVSILYFEFDPTGWELPITFPIKIIPLDETGNPADEFEKEACIEKPHGAGGSCTTDLQSSFWEWVYYKRDNPYFFTGTWYPHTEESTTNGCCIDGESDPNAICTGTDNNRQLDYEILFIRPLLYMLFDGAGTVWVGGQLYSRNLNPSISNFCANSAGYSESNLKVTKDGEYTINTDCSISIDKIYYHSTNPPFLVDPTLYVGGGPSIKYTIISDHYIEQTITSTGGPDGGGSGEIIGSVFERRRNLDPDFHIWYD